jgi:hypothetical protein
MSDISVNAANVLRAVSTNGLPGSSTEHGRLGATCTAGQAVYRDSTDNYDFKLADANAAAASEAYGILLNGGADGQPAEVVRDGLYAPGGTVVVGMVYAVSAAAPGGIAPYGDLASGDYVCILGVGITTALILVDIIVSKIAKP